MTPPFLSNLRPFVWIGLILIVALVGVGLKVNRYEKPRNDAVVSQGLSSDIAARVKRLMAAHGHKPAGFVRLPMGGSYRGAIYKRAHGCLSTILIIPVFGNGEAGNLPILASALLSSSLEGETSDIFFVYDGFVYEEPPVLTLHLDSYIKALLEMVPGVEPQADTQPFGVISFGSCLSPRNYEWETTL